MHKFNRMTGTIAKWIILFFFTIAIAILTLQSLFSTAYIASSEKTYYAADKPFRHFVVFILLVISMSVIRYFTSKLPNRDMLDKIGVVVLLVISVGVSYVIFKNTQLYPRSDQRLVLLAAAQLREGDFSSMEPGGYLALWPHQMGATLYQYFLSFLIGPNNHIGNQIWNIVMLGLFQVIFFLLIKRIFAQLSHSSTMFGIVSFLPLTFYVSFVYGNIAGLAFSTLAIYMFVRYTEEHNLAFASIAVIALWISILMKGNYLILLIALGIYLLVDYITTMEKKSLALVLVLVLCYFSSNLFVHVATQKITGRDVPKGVPTIGWVAMGMQEGYAAKGWFNTYVTEIYDTCGGDSDVIAKTAMQDIQTSLKGFAADPVYARQFYGEKIASQWNNPSFQCFWIFYDRTTDIQVPSWMKDIVTGNMRNRLISLFNLWQTQILLGVCLYIIYRFRKCDWKELLLALCFVGGFLFHLLWEAKCQYTVSYFVLLILYAAVGFHELLQDINGKMRALRNRNMPLGEKLFVIASRKITYIMLGFLLIVLLGSIYQGAWFTDTIKITKDNDRFQEKVTPVEVEY